MKRLVVFVASVLLTVQVSAEDLSPPNLLRIVPGDNGVYVDLERRDEDVDRNVRYCVYISDQSGGLYEQAARFWAKLYKGNYLHTNGYIGHLTNGTPYFFVVTVQSEGKESAFSNEVAATPVENDNVAVPYIDGKWWRICERSPDVAPYNNHPDHNSCDFTIWRDDNGKWHCVSCIRSTTYPSKTRLLYHWQTDRITDTDWSQDKRIFWTSGTEGTPDILGRRLEDGPYKLERGMQAPHCLKVGDRYYMFHNNDGCFCLSSPDGDDETFTMQPRHDGEIKFFDMGRDVGLFDNRARDGYWYAYYTSNNSALNGTPGVDARRAKDILGPWSDPLPCRSRGFSNPVGDKPIHMGDPFVIQHEGNYYLFGTNAPNEGFRCLVSSDLVYWEPKGWAYRETPDSWAKSHYWAPEVKRYRGKFYMTYSAMNKASNPPRLLIALAVSDKPKGPYHDLHAPWFDFGYSAIDGHIFVDDDDKPYLYFSRNGVQDGYSFGIMYGVALTDDLSKPIGEPVKLMEADQPWEKVRYAENRCNEGAFVLKHQGRYYMTYSANHTGFPHYGIGYATADRPLGPWVKAEENPIAATNLNIGVSGPGHSCITSSPDGSEKFIVYHTHANAEKPSGDRVVNIDRIDFDESGKLKILGPTRSPQPMPPRSE